MKQFFLEIPTRVYFGRGEALKALEKEKPTLGRRSMVISTSKSLERMGFLAEMTDRLEELQGRSGAIVYNQVSPEPQLSEVSEAIRIGKAEGVTSIIGFGGGSSIDAAKAVALGIGTAVPFERCYYDGAVPNEEPIPVIAVPTTAGTGSELSGSAVISDVATNMKKGVRGRYMYPTAAIVDPRYTDTLPPALTKDTGFDAFAHAVETLVSVKATRLSAQLSVDAVKLISEALPSLRTEPGNREARDAMSYASMLMGINIGNVGTLLPHRLQYPVGMKTHTSHGAGLLALFPAWYQEAYHCAAEKVCKVSALLCGRPCKTEEDCLNALVGFIDAIGGARSLRELGVDERDIEQFSRGITGVLENDPAYDGKAVIERIYKKALA